MIATIITIAMQSKSTAPYAISGRHTIHQDQAITPVSLSTRKTRNRIKAIQPKPIPPPEVVLFDIFIYHPFLYFVYLLYHTFLILSSVFENLIIIIFNFFYNVKAFVKHRWSKPFIHTVKHFFGYLSFSLCVS